MRNDYLKIFWLGLMFAFLIRGNGQEMNMDSLFAVWTDTSQEKEVRLEAYYARFSVIQNEFANPEVNRWIGEVETALDLATETGRTDYLSRFQMVQAGLEYLTSSDPTTSCTISQVALKAALEQQDYHSALISSFLLAFAKCENVDGMKSREAVMAQIPDIIDSLVQREHSPSVRKSAYLLTGDFYYTLNAYTEALRYYQQAFQFSAPAILNESESISIENLGSLLMYTGNYTEAATYFRIGLNLSKQIDDKRQIGLFYNALAETALHQENSSLSQTMLDSATFFMEGEDAHLSPGQRSCYPCLMKTQRIRAGIDNALGKHQDALEKLQKLHDFYADNSQPGSSGNVQFFYAELGKAYLGLGQAQQALDVAQIGLAKDKLSPVGTAANLAVMYKAWQALEKHRNAFTYYQKYITLRDSLSRLRNGQEVIRLELKHQFQQERLADSLSVAQVQLEQELAFQGQLSQQKINRNIGVGIGLGAILLAIGLFSRLRHIRKTRDLLEEKNALIEAEKQKAQASERAKQQFLANMSHEIRTPMNAIKGMTDILLRREPKESQKDYLGAIKESSNSLLVIINDILDLSKIEAGKIELEEIPFHLPRVIANVKAIMQFKAEEKGLELHSSLPADTLPAVIGDPTRLHQVLLNLVGNAIKFTEKGLVSIRLKAVQTADKLEVECCVADTGVGIGQDRLDKIFESFEQAYSDTTRKFGGTGLGLSISKKLVEVQQGKIWAESEKGKGSQFYVQLSFPIAYQPAPEGPSPEARTDMASQLKDLRILLVEDNTFNAIVAQEELEDAVPDIYIDLAENGAIAVEKIQSADYDLVLMDVQMPVMNGYEATEKIRALDSPKGKIPIIAMTANVMKEEVERCYAAGMDDFIGKPFEVEDLIRKISSLRKSAS